MDAIEASPPHYENEENLEEYKYERILTQIPPDWTIARHHKEAHMLEARAHTHTVHSTCECCGDKYTNSHYKLCDASSKMAYNGFGISLYFYLLKLLVGMTAVLAVVCLVNRAVYTHITQHPYEGVLMSIFTSVYVGIYLLACRFINWKLRNASIKLDTKVLDHTDYSIMLSNLPTKNLEEGDVIQSFCKTFDIERSEIKRAVFAFNIEEFILTAKEYSTLKRTIQVIENYRGGDEKSTAYPPFMRCIKYDSIKERFESIKGHRTDVEERPDDYLGRTGVCFITFNKTMVKDKILKLNKKSKLVYQCYQVKIEEADPPYDIKWGNLNYTTQKLRSAISFIVVTLIMGAGFFIQYILENHTSLQSTNESPLKNVLYSFIMTVLHIIIDISLLGFSKYEKHYSKTRQMASLSLKIAIFAFINASFFPMLANLKTASLEPLIEAISSNLTFLLFLTPLIKIIRIPYIVNKVITYIFRRIKAPVPQYTANNLVQLPKESWQVIYSDTIFIVYFAFFYSLIYPMAILLLCIGLGFIYWVQKICTISLFRCPPQLSSSIAIVSGNSLIFGSLLIAISNSVFTYKYDSPHLLFSLSPFIVIGAFLLIEVISLKCTCKCKKGSKGSVMGLLSLNQEKFHNRFKDVAYDILKMGENDYMALNPLTRNEALKEYYDEAAKIDKSDQSKEHLSDKKNKLNAENITNYLFNIGAILKRKKQSISEQSSKLIDPNPTSEDRLPQQ